MLLDTGAASDLRFANYYGDHMVLQRAPASAIVWGYEPDCDDVSVNFNKATVKADIMAGDGTKVISKIQKALSLLCL